MIQSIAGVCEVHRFGADGPPSLLIEVAHGATRRAHFDALRRQLQGPFPDDLIDFFFVNTDVGAPEVALALARAIVAAQPRLGVLVVRCELPRTFVDCNRVIDTIDASKVPTTSTATGMTPGIVRYVTDAADLRLLLEKYAQYRDVVTRAFELVCGTQRGAAVMMHSYAPRSVDVPVDENIVQSLHKAYAPDVEPTWPLRAEVDLITTTPEKVSFADARLVELVKEAFTAAGVQVEDSVAYPMHPSTLAYAFAEKYRGQTLCLELRRDLLVEKFTPFAEMKADDAKVARMGGLLATALMRWRGWQAPR